MDRKMQYQDFEPFFEWTEDEGSATLIIMLPGFRRDQMKVQVTSTPLLRINGEREITENLRRRFAKEFPIPPYCDTNNVSAKFERGMLFIKFPKMQQVVTPAPSDPQESITTTPPDKPQPTIYKAPLLPTPPNEPQPQPEPEPAAPQKEKEENKKQEKEPISDEKEKSQGGAAAAATFDEVVANDDDKKMLDKPEPEPVASQKEKEPISDVKEKGKELASTADGNDEKVRAKDDYGLSKTSEVAASKALVEKKGANKMAQRLKTRVLDFTLSVRSGGGDGNDYDKDDVNYTQISGLVTRVIKRPKMLMNIIVSILLVLVLWTYVKNAFRSSPSSSLQGGPKFQEL